LRERGFEKTTIREVAAVAGVGVGTFYEYFGNMRALAAVCIHERVKALARDAHAAGEAAQGQPLVQVVDTLLSSLVQGTLGQAADWAALFLVERQISGVEAFRKHYEAQVRMWQAALEGASDAPADAPGAARMLHAMCYGWVSQSLLALGPQVDAQALHAQLRKATLAYVQTLVRQKI
jgi:AcrR family transcriptional regulator